MFVRFLIEVLFSTNCQIDFTLWNSLFFNDPLGDDCRHAPMEEVQDAVMDSVYRCP